MMDTVYLGPRRVKLYAVHRMPQPPKIHADEVLAQALALLEEGGEGSVTVRAVAARLGVTPNALYWHFDNRETLLGALAARGMGELRDALAGAVPPRAAALADLSPVAAAYLHFARTRPHLYALMTAPHVDPRVSGELWSFVLDLLTPRLGARRAAEAGVALWAYLHGGAGLEAMRPFHGGKPESGVEAGLRALLWGLEQEDA